MKIYRARFLWHWKVRLIGVSVGGDGTVSQEGRCLTRRGAKRVALRVTRNARAGRGA